MSVDANLDGVRETRTSVRALVNNRQLALGSATVALGLMAGLFYAFACAIVPGLKGTGDRAMIDTMQQINIAIENPVFFATFMGSGFLIGWAIVLERRAGDRRAVRLLWLALAAWAANVLITGAFNIPLNNELRDAGDPATIADPAAVRDHFMASWVGWNIARTVVVTAGFAVMCKVLMRRR